jgi:hypothetical protein
MDPALLTYLCTKDLLYLEDMADRPAYRVDPTREQRAKALVADPYPVQVLSAEPNRATELITGDCEELSVIRPHAAAFP